MSHCMHHAMMGTVLTEYSSGDLWLNRAVTVTSSNNNSYNVSKSKACKAIGYTRSVSAASTAGPSMVLDYPDPTLDVT
jgi:hypothetical protein